MKKEEEDLLRLKEILDSIGFEFFLVQGTLLGAVRDGTLIDYDKDFDLGTFEDLGDSERRAYIVEALQQEGLKCQIRGPEWNSVKLPSYWVLITGFKWLVALMPCKQVGDIVSMTTSPLRYPAKLFAEMREFDFLGTQFRIPYPPEDWLEFNYGATWRINAKRSMVVRKADSFELIHPPSIEKHYIKCTSSGELIYPLESIGLQLD